MTAHHLAIQPERIGRYRIVRPLGEGGMGKLYVAEDPRLDRLVAIKLLKDDSPEFRARFLREARTAARLRHVNIVTIFEVDEHDCEPFIAMEYIPGETLADVIRARRLMRLPAKLAVIEDVCTGLAHAHRGSIVHRDVKPANIMIDCERTVKIVDFGIARLEEGGMTRSGVIVGTPNYMSPEQLSGRGVDLRSDVFAVGAVLYELITYQQAFPGVVPQVWHHIVNRDPVALTTIDPQLDADVVSIVERALAKDPADRYQDLGAMRHDLSRARARLASALDGTTLVVPRADTLSASPSQLLFAAAVARARTALDSANLDAARKELEAASALRPGHVEILALHDRLIDALNVDQAHDLVARAKTLLNSGDMTGAYSLARRADELAPGDEAVAGELAAIERARGARDRARQSRARDDEQLRICSEPPHVLSEPQARQNAHLAPGVEMAARSVQFSRGSAIAFAASVIVVVLLLIGWARVSVPGHAGGSPANVAETRKPHQPSPQDPASVAEPPPEPSATPDAGPAGIAVMPDRPSTVTAPPPDLKARGAPAAPGKTERAQGGLRNPIPDSHGPVALRDDRTVSVTPPPQQAPVAVEKAAVEPPVVPPAPAPQPPPSAAPTAPPTWLAVPVSPPASVTVEPPRPQTPALPPGRQRGRRVTVFVSAATTENGFVAASVNGNGIEDSVRDVRIAIASKAKDRLELVETEADADLRIAIIERAVVDTGQVMQLGGAAPVPVSAYVVDSVLKVGDHEEPIRRAVPSTYLLGGPWRTAANQIASAVDTFARNNYDRIIAMRTSVRE